MNRTTFWTRYFPYSKLVSFIISRFPAHSINYNPVANLRQKNLFTGIGPSWLARKLYLCALKEHKKHKPERVMQLLDFCDKVLHYKSPMLIFHLTLLGHRAMAKSCVRGWRDCPFTPTLPRHRFPQSNNDHIKRPKADSPIRPGIQFFMHPSISAWHTS